MKAEQKFLKLAQQAQWFDKHDKVLVALSGGLDSMTLFNWLYDFRSTLNIELGIAHINHGLRAESDHEEQELRKIAEQKQIPIYVDRFTGQFTEQNARQFRYRFFEKIMQEKGYTALVTAHHQGDVVETVLMREITGRPLRSLQGIKEKQTFAGGELIRPLLQFEKSEFDAPVFFEDWTNQGTAYFRNRVRNQLIPELTQENPQFPAAISELSSEISLALSVITDKIAALSVIDDKNEKVNLSIYQKQSSALKYFILQAYFANFPLVAITKVKLQELLKILEKPAQYRAPLNKDYLFVKDFQHFYIEKIAESQALKTIDVRQEDPKDASYMRVDLPLEGKMEIRKRQPGDEILIKGHHKKLRKYFIENHVPLEKRQNFLILVDNKVYAIVDLVCSDLSKAIKNDKIKRTVWVKALL